jgi:hypothetical protein
MRGLEPEDGARLVYLTIDEVSENYIVWQVACTRISGYFYGGPEADTKNVDVGQPREEAMWADPYWKSKCASVVAALEAATPGAFAARLMATCQMKCETGASMELRSCLRDAETEGQYRKCREYL